jgi:N-acetylmuramoyl-L-alanine amidase
VKHTFFSMANPDRLVIDLEGVDLGDELKALPAKIGEADPYIQAVRVAVNRPNVVRVVFDLRGEAKPSVFPLAPPANTRTASCSTSIPPSPPIRCWRWCSRVPTRSARSPVRRAAAPRPISPAESLPVPTLPVVKVPVPPTATVSVTSPA